MAPPRADSLPVRGAPGFLQRVGSALQLVPRPLAVLPVLAWAALIWFLSSRPPADPGDDFTLPVLLANCAHAVEFGFFALLIALTLPRADGWPRLDRRGVLTALVVTVLYAAADELHQSTTPGRNASVPDVLTDLCGAACTLWIAAYVVRAGATEAGLAKRFGLGLLACFTCGVLATVLPGAFPDVVWL